MKVNFVCLANIKKNSGRAVAGIEIEPTFTDDFIIKKNNQKPKWVRPISSYSNADMPSFCVSNINLLDVVEVEAIEYCPYKHMSENLLSDHKTINRVSNLHLTSRNLDKFVDHSKDFLFSNNEKLLEDTRVKELDHSLIFIKPTNVYIYFEENEFVLTKQMMARFEYKEVEYNLPVTDEVFLSKFTKNFRIVTKLTKFYFTIAISPESMGWYIKHIAGILYI